MKRFYAFLICILLFSLLFGCKQKKESTSPPMEESSPLPAATPEPASAPTATPAPLSCVGVWKVELRDLTITLTITSDGNFTLVQGEKVRQGQVSEEEDVLLFVWEEDSYSCGFDLEGSTLLLRQEGYEDLLFSLEVSPQ